MGVFHIKICFFFFPECFSHIYYRCDVWIGRSNSIKSILVLIAMLAYFNLHWESIPEPNTLECLLIVKCQFYYLMCLSVFSHFWICYNFLTSVFNMGTHHFSSFASVFETFWVHLLIHFFLTLKFDIIHKFLTTRYGDTDSNAISIYILFKIALCLF